MLEALLGHVSPEGLVHPAVEADSHERPGRVLHLMHGGSQMAANVAREDDPGILLLSGVNGLSFSY